MVLIFPSKVVPLYTAHFFNAPRLRGTLRVRGTLYSKLTSFHSESVSSVDAGQNLRQGTRPVRNRFQLRTTNRWLETPTVACPLTASLLEAVVTPPVQETSGHRNVLPLQYVRSMGRRLTATFSLEYSIYIYITYSFTHLLHGVVMLLSPWALNIYDRWRFILNLCSWRTLPLVCSLFAIWFSCRPALLITPRVRSGAFWFIESEPAFRWDVELLL